jgi:glycopeptide antibiotics resistance protein
VTEVAPGPDAATGPDAPTRRRRLLTVLFALYLVLLCWGILYKWSTWIGVGDVRRVIKLVPFAPAVGLGASQPLEVLANVLLFIPFGVFVGLLLPRWGAGRRIALMAGMSVLFETAQYILAIGNSDITDVMMNTAGGIIGLVILAFVRARLGDRTERAMTRVLLVVMVVAVLAIAAFIASPIRYGPPHGVPPDRLGGAPGMAP